MPRKPTVAYKDETGYHTSYTVQYITNYKKLELKNSLAKTTHGSEDGEVTICGKKLDEYWYIANNTFDGKITCKKCINILKKLI